VGEVSSFIVACSPDHGRAIVLRGSCDRTGNGLAPLDVKEVARGYRAEALRLKPVANEKNQVLGKISDFIFSKDGSDIFVVLAVHDLSGPGRHLIAIPFQRIKLDDPSGYLVLGASAAALDKLPVFPTIGESPQAALTRRRSLPRISQ
jgi:hypothetical protein